MLARAVQSIIAACGVYKGQGRNQRKLTTCHDLRLLRWPLYQFGPSIDLLFLLGQQFLRPSTLVIKAVITSIVIAPLFRLLDCIYHQESDALFDILRTTIDRLVVQERVDETEQMINALLHLSRVSLFSNDEALVAALTAMEAVQEDVAVPNETRYYIRSMEFTREEFQQAIQQYRNDYAADSLFADHLLNQIQEHPNELLFFVRARHL